MFQNSRQDYFSIPKKIQMNIHITEKNDAYWEFDGEEMKIGV